MPIRVPRPLRNDPPSDRTPRGHMESFRCGACGGRAVVEKGRVRVVHTACPRNRLRNEHPETFAVK